MGYFHLFLYHVQQMKPYVNLHDELLSTETRNKPADYAKDGEMTRSPVNSLRTYLYPTEKAHSKSL